MPAPLIGLAPRASVNHLSLKSRSDSNIFDKIFDLPAALKGKRVEVIILPVQETKDTAVPKGSAYGCLRKYADLSLLSKENGTWEQAMVTKHADS